MHPDRSIIVVIPELVEDTWYEYFLHNQRGRLLESFVGDVSDKTRAVGPITRGTAAVSTKNLILIGPIFLSFFFDSERISNPRSAAC